ncbi:MAG: hypothetical protein QXD03_01280 [Candidatus Anstonellales archaeon]
MLEIIKSKVEELNQEIPFRHISIKKIEQELNNSLFDYMLKQGGLIKRFFLLFNPDRAREEIRAKKYSEILGKIQKELPALIFTIPNIIPSKDGVQVIGELPLEILRATRILHIDVMPYLRRRVLDLNYVTEDPNQLKLIYFYPDFVARYEFFRDRGELEDIAKKIVDFHLEIGDMIRDLIIDYAMTRNKLVGLYIITSY